MTIEELSKGTLQTDCCTGLMPGAVSLAEEKDHDIERRSGTTNMGSSRDLFSMGFDLEQLLEDTDFTLPLITMPVPRKRHTPRRGLSCVTFLGGGGSFEGRSWCVGQTGPKSVHATIGQEWHRKARNSKLGSGANYFTTSLIDNFGAIFPATPPL